MAKKNDMGLAEQLSLAIPQTAEVEIIEENEIANLSKADYLREKNKLEQTRSLVALRLDGRKLQQVEKILDAMDNCLDGMINPDATAMDMQAYSKAFDNLNKTLATTMRLDTIDGSGTAARLALRVQFGNGTSLETLIEH